MPEHSDSDEDRTENATAYRREEFRKQGVVAISRELLAVIGMVCLLGVLSFSLKWMSSELQNLIVQYLKFGVVGEFGKAELSMLFLNLIKNFTWILTPVLLIALIAGLIASLIQAGFYVTWEPLTPNWGRINPVEGFQRLISSKGAVEALKAILKVVLVSWVGWRFLSGLAPKASLLYSQGVAEGFGTTLNEVSSLALQLILVLGVLAVADYFFQRYQVEKQMKMSRREVKEEYKLREGDPLLKQRIRTVQRKIANRRMMENVPKASVVVTNPTHIACALQYEEGMPAPKLVAKGAGVVADKIKEIAKFNGIPIVENKPLARTMFKTLQIGQHIPRDLYKAVAEILIYVYKLKGRIGGLRAQVT